MYQTIAHFSAAVTAGAADFDLPAVTDQSNTISNSHYIFTRAWSLFASYCLGASVLRAKVSTPRLRRIALPYLRPVERAAAVPNRPLVNIVGPGGPILDPIDETQLLISNDAGAAEAESALLFLHDNNLNIPQGEIFTVRATGAITGSTGAWVAGAITMDQVLPAGRYSVVGMECRGAGLLAARLVFPLQVFRPGCVATVLTANFPGEIFRMGRMGELGQFESIAQPLLEVFQLSANTAQELYLDLIKVR